MSEQTYKNGSFTVVRDTISIGGKEWLGLRIDCTSGTIRLPIDDPRLRRQVELRAELAALRMLGDEIQKALDDHENQEEK